METYFSDITAKISPDVDDNMGATFVAAFSAPWVRALTSAAVFNIPANHRSLASVLITGANLVIVGNYAQGAEFCLEYPPGMTVGDSYIFGVLGVDKNKIVRPLYNLLGEQTVTIDWADADYRQNDAGTLRYSNMGLTEDDIKPFTFDAAGHIAMIPYTTQMPDYVENPTNQDKFNLMCRLLS